MHTCCTSSGCWLRQRIRRDARTCAARRAGRPLRRACSRTRATLRSGSSTGAAWPRASWPTWATQWAAGWAGSVSGRGAGGLGGLATARCPRPPQALGAQAAVCVHYWPHLQPPHPCLPHCARLMPLLLGTCRLRHRGPAAGAGAAKAARPGPGQRGACHGRGRGGGGGGGGGGHGRAPQEAQAPRRCAPPPPQRGRSAARGARCAARGAWRGRGARRGARALRVPELRAGCVAWRGLGPGGDAVRTGVVARPACLCAYY